MGMFSMAESATDTICIDENYTGVMGCMQLMSDCIHNEQVMFESLFAMDFKEALNEEADEEDTSGTDEEGKTEGSSTADAKKANIVKRLGAFIISAIEGLKAKINSIIDGFTAKLDAKKSKELKELAAKLPSDLTADNEKFKALVEKYKDAELLKNSPILGKGYILGKLEITNKYKDSDFKYKMERDKMFKFYTATETQLFITNLKDPSYIIDSTLSDLKNIKKIGTQYLDTQKKDIKRNLVDSKKAKNEEDIKDAKVLLDSVKVAQKNFTDYIAQYMKRTTDTYKAYLYCLNVLTKESKSKKKDDTSSPADTKEETVNDSYLMELEESINYDVDYEFGTL